MSDQFIKLTEQPSLYDHLEQKKELLADSSVRAVLDKYDNH